MAEFKQNPIEIVNTDEPIHVDLPIEIEGYCLLFDVDRIDHNISRQCCFDIPEKIPIIWKNDILDYSPIGYGHVTRIDDTGVYIKGYLNNISGNRKNEFITFPENFIISAGGNNVELNNDKVINLRITYCGIIEINHSMYRQYANLKPLTIVT